MACMTRSSDEALARLSRRQFGVFAIEQAVDLGVARQTVLTRLRQGRYRSMLPGIVAEAGAPDSWEARAMAAQLAIGGEAALARWTAGQVLGLDIPRQARDGLHLLVRTRTFVTPPGITVHRTGSLDESDIARRGPLIHTTATRTIADLAGMCGPVALRRLVADAVRRDLTTATELRAMCRRLGRIRGKRQLLALVAELSPLERDCRTELESQFLRVMTVAGLPPTAMNHPVTDVFGKRRFLDAVYLPERVPIELDSKSAHGSLLDWHDDLRRENAIVLADWRDFLRFSWDDVTKHPDLVVKTVRTALEAQHLR